MNKIENSEIIQLFDEIMFFGFQNLEFVTWKIYNLHLYTTEYTYFYILIYLTIMNKSHKHCILCYVKRFQFIFFVQQNKFSCTRNAIDANTCNLSRYQLAEKVQERHMLNLARRL